ncbi:hypothetical protein MKX01_030049 [Papaver californicum]|nr:hypothetical protein MKX01_030049 [Papaver californicum]
MANSGEDDQIARNVRGPTTLKFLDTLCPGQRLQVESWLNSPVGPNSNYMSTYISHLAKDGNKFPLTISWDKMPAVLVLNAMSDIKKVFDYPDDLNDWIRDKLHDRWKSHKHSVKKEGFYKYTTQEERLAHRPKDVVESQWGPLIEYWQDPRQEAKCAKSKANKSKQRVQHRGGSKSHVKYAAELEAKLKRPPTAQEIFDATHAKQKMQMEGLENKPSQHSSQSSSTRQNDAIMQAESDESLEGFRMANGGEEGQLARKVRGPRSLKFLDTLLPGQRLQVESWLNSPVGPNSTYLTTYISHLSKDGNKLPLTITHWNQMPAVFILNAVLEVKKVYDCPDDLNDWIIAKLHDRWKDHKHFVKKEGFYKYTTQEERLSHRPKDVVESQWGPLIEYWQDPRQEEKAAKMKERKAKQTVRHSGGAKPHVKYAAELEAKLKRPPTAQEIYDATHAKRKKQMEALENYPNQHTSESSATRQNDATMQLTGQDLMSPVSSSKKMKMSAAASGSWEINAVSGPEHLPLTRSNSIPTSPVPLIQECVTEDEEDNMQAESDESLEGFGSAGEPVEAARTASSSEPVEAAKTTSYTKCPTVASKLVSISSPKDISSPFVKSTSVWSDEEFEFVDNFKIPKEYAVLYKMIFGKYGHMSTKKVIKSNDTLLVACVTGLLKIISTMETVLGADLSEALLESWEGEIEDAENLGFNIKWLRKKFDEVKNNWKSSSGIRKEVEIHEKELDATQVKYVDLLARKEELHRETSKVIIEIRKAEAKLSSEKKIIQEKLGPESNFLNEPVLGKVLS